MPREWFPKGKEDLLRLLSTKNIKTESINSIEDGSKTTTLNMSILSKLISQKNVKDQILMIVYDQIPSLSSLHQKWISRNSTIYLYK